MNKYLYPPKELTLPESRNTVGIGQRANGLHGAAWATWPNDGGINAFIYFCDCFGKEKWNSNRLDNGEGQKGVGTPSGCGCSRSGHGQTDYHRRPARRNVHLRADSQQGSIAGKYVVEPSVFGWWII